MKRRQFIRITSFTGGGWILAQLIPLPVQEQPFNPLCFQPDPLIKLCDDGTIILYVNKQEMGQGVNTSLPMILAEELEADWKDVRVEPLPFDVTKDMWYHGTIGSLSIVQNWIPLRTAGATAREMLTKAAAITWNIPAEKCYAEKSKVINSVTGQSLTYQSLIAKASTLEVPTNPGLKKIKDFKIIGSEKKKTNLQDIVNGKAKYSIDITVPGMLYATIVRCPVYKGKVKKWDDSAMKKMNGIVDMIEISEMAGCGNGVAIITTDTWAAIKVQELLKVEWDLGPGANMNSSLYLQMQKKKIKETPDLIFDKKGEKAELIATNNTSFYTAAYETPFQAHATLEPANCIAHYKDGKFELWGGIQVPVFVTERLSKAFNIKPQDIFINMAIMGGGFGRKSAIDYVAETMQIAKAIGKPVKLLFTRQDDIRFAPCRPATYQQISARIENKTIKEWQHRIVSSDWAWKTVEAEGGAFGDFYYPAIEFRSSLSFTEAPVQLGAWRSLARSNNCFVIESFIDELARVSNSDPLDFRLHLLKQMSPQKLGRVDYNPRRLEQVMLKCAEMIDWKSKKTPGHFKGIACFPFYTTYIAHAFEITVNTKRQFKIHKAACAIDCGIAINPGEIKAQLEGALAWALIATMRGEITIDKGRVQQSNFNDFHVLRMNEMPALEVHIISSEEYPGGVGEIGVPTVAPAFCNAIAAATGIRLRKLPISKDGFYLMA